MTAFPIAELLVQNGAVIPTSMPAFPLSASAQLYVDQKSGKDTLSELPTIVRNGALQLGGGSGGAGGGAGVGVGAAEKEKEKEGAKLQKRGSRGGTPSLTVRPAGGGGGGGGGGGW